jgi:FkbM family methyltransferase
MLKYSDIIFKIEKLKTYWQTSFQIGEYNIQISKRHSLPLYHKKYRLYDRFIPVLVKNIPRKGKIVDVGANIGDTLFASLFNCKNDFVCIEGSEFFFEYLTNNIALLPESEQKRITKHKTLVGTGNISGELSHVSGRTANINTNNTTFKTHTPLDEVVNINENVILIKSDTDGYDWDVLLSALKTIETHKPVLFWENEVYDTLQRDGYIALYKAIKSLGYSKIFLFDNYGNIIMEEVDIDILLELNNYLLSMNKGQSSRTIFYVDVLAVTEDKLPIARAAMQEFRSEYKLG